MRWLMKILTNLFHPHAPEEHEELERVKRERDQIWERLSQLDVETQQRRRRHARN